MAEGELMTVSRTKRIVVKTTTWRRKQRTKSLSSTELKSLGVSLEKQCLEDMFSSNIPNFPPKKNIQNILVTIKGKDVCCLLCHSHSQLCIGIDGTAQSTHPLRSSQANWEGWACLQKLSGGIGSKNYAVWQFYCRTSWNVLAQTMTAMMTLGNVIMYVVHY